ncbi:MAG: hypothetical protein COB54_07845 [Alphaproteobacteria bacterium]|nr:MAG: hypothetical protein COB54_07845 [Alphaproteobacteria bacterium]
MMSGIYNIVRFEFNNSPWKIANPQQKRFLGKAIPPLPNMPKEVAPPVFWTCTPPFYQNVNLICISHNLGEDEKINLYYLQHYSPEDKENTFHFLNGLSHPIHVLNSKISLILAPEHILDYLCFFCFFVHGESGPFYVLRNREDPAIPQSIWAGDFFGCDSLNDLFREPCVTVANPEGSTRYSTLIYYSNVLSIADFSIQPDGMIMMEESESLLSDLPFTLNISLKI